MWRVNGCGPFIVIKERADPEVAFGASELVSGSRGRQSVNRQLIKRKHEVDR